MKLYRVKSTLLDLCFPLLSIVTLQNITEHDLKILRCPTTRASLTLTGDSLKSEKGESFSVRSNVPILLSEKFKSFIETFESKYTLQNEPWDYSRRAVEQVRHVYVAEKTQELIGSGQRVLDIGCALGQLTHLLKNKAPEVWAMDISPTAAVKANQVLAEKTGWSGFKVIAASATELPFADSSFKLVLLSDGLVGWELTKELQLEVLNEVYRVLEPGGYAVLTDYLNPRDFESHRNHVLKGPLQFVATEFLGDRIGFQIANNFKPISGVWPFSSLLGSLSFNQFLSQISKPLGPSMSKHMSVILKKP